MVRSKLMKGLVQGLSKEMTGSQRRALRAVAHSYRPIVIVGFNGVSEGVIGSLDAALEAHELVKVKVLGSFEGDLAESVEMLAVGTGSLLVQKVGRIFLFYRQREKDSSIYFKDGKLVVEQEG